MKGKTATYYANNPKARKRHNDYEKEYDKMDRQVKRRVELNRENRKRGTYGDKSGPNAFKDLAHHPSGKFTYKSPSKNRSDKDDSPGDRRARGIKKKK